MNLPVKHTVTVNSIQQRYICCLVEDEKDTIQLNYYPEEETIVFQEKKNLTKKIRKFQFQLVKVLKSAMKGDLSVGQTISCVFIEDFNFLGEKDYSNFIRMDRSDGKTEITTHQTELKGAYKVFADGSYSDSMGASGYGGVIQEPNGSQEIYLQSFEKGSSNLMELLAITEGLHRLSHVQKIQVNTDSRFVIRGLTQWVHFWRHNNWQTAYGNQVKFAKYWQHIDQLCEGKIIEFKWIKGHSGHEEQSFCHDLAKELTFKGNRIQKNG